MDIAVPPRSPKKKHVVPQLPANSLQLSVALGFGWLQRVASPRAPSPGAHLQGLMQAGGAKSRPFFLNGDNADEPVCSRLPIDVAEALLVCTAVPLCPSNPAFLLAPIGYDS